MLIEVVKRKEEKRGGEKSRRCSGESLCDIYIPI